MYRCIYIACTHRQTYTQRAAAQGRWLGNRRGMQRSRVISAQRGVLYTERKTEVGGRSAPDKSIGGDDVLRLNFFFEWSFLKRRKRYACFDYSYIMDFKKYFGFTVGNTLYIPEPLDNKLVHSYNIYRKRQTHPNTIYIFFFFLEELSAPSRVLWKTLYISRDARRLNKGQPEGRKEGKERGGEGCINGGAPGMRPEHERPPLNERALARARGSANGQSPSLNEAPAQPHAHAYTRESVAKPIWIIKRFPWLFFPSYHFVYTHIYAPCFIVRLVRCDYWLVDI